MLKCFYNLIFTFSWFKIIIYLVSIVQLGREGQEAINPVENLRTLWNGLRTPWKVSEPRGGGFLKKVIKYKYNL